MQLLINDRWCEIDEGTTLATIIELMGWQMSAVAIAIDGCFIARHQWHQYILKAGQELEVVSPMQGG